jgi:hypothetical protein
MNALDFIKLPFSTEGLPFTIPATSSLVTATANVVAGTTSAAVLPSNTIRPFTEGASAYNTSTPVGFLLYVAAQSQRLLVSGSAGGILFGGPTRSYWILTLFMV